MAKTFCFKTQSVLYLKYPPIIDEKCKMHERIFLYNYRSTYYHMIVYIRTYTYKYVHVYTYINVYVTKKIFIPLDRYMKKYMSI